MNFNNVELGITEIEFKLDKVRPFSRGLQRHTHTHTQRITEQSLNAKWQSNSVALYAIMEWVLSIASTLLKRMKLNFAKKPKSIRTSSTYFSIYSQPVQLQAYYVTDIECRISSGWSFFGETELYHHRVYLSLSRTCEGLGRLFRMKIFLSHLGEMSQTREIGITFCVHPLPVRMYHYFSREDRLLCVILPINPRISSEVHVRCLIDCLFKKLYLKFRKSELNNQPENWDFLDALIHVHLQSYTRCQLVSFSSLIHEFIIQIKFHL